MAFRAAICVSAFALLAIVSAQTPPPGHTIVAQCKCSDLDECADVVKAKTDRCKKTPQCVQYLTQIGDANKIMQCLDRDHEQMTAVETCAKKKLNGELGCTNSATPVNLTIPLIPVIEVPSVEESAAAGANATSGNGQPQQPIQLSQYLMCIDECAHDDMDVIPGRKKRSPATCAFKLKCALAPPAETTQNAYIECQKELKYDPTVGAAQSCKCLQAAGVAMQCP